MLGYLNYIFGFLLLVVSSPLLGKSTQDSLPVNKKSPYYNIGNTKKKTTLPYEFKDSKDDTVAKNERTSPLYLESLGNVKKKVEYDSATKSYYLMERVGNFWYRRPKALTKEEYLAYDIAQSKEDFWFRRARDTRQQYQYRLLPGARIEKESFLDKILGDGTISLKAKGSADIGMGLRFSKVDNPSIPEENRTHTSFFMDPRFQASVSGGLGDILKLDLNYDTQATFDFSNKTNLTYDGDEDDIIKKVEAGNVSLSLQNSLIRGGNDLFGLKTDLQFGKLFVTTVFSQQKGEMKTVNLRNGVQERPFQIDAADYDENRHFFLSKYFRDNYNKATETLPIVNTDINIVRVEVWITNVAVNYTQEELRNLVAFVDLGENKNNIYNSFIHQNTTLVSPANQTNNLYELLTTTYSGARTVASTNSTLQSIPNFMEGKDFVKLETARKLKDSEFSFHPKLGYISLRMPLRKNEIVAVAYEYVKGGQSYKVGEFTNSGPSAPDNLYVKLLKGLSSSPNLPTWDLMMKNIYSIGASNIPQENFTLDVAYKEDGAGGLPLNYINAGVIAGKPLLEVLGLDRLNKQMDKVSDGFFDFLPGTTFISERGLVVFPVLEPFGKDLRVAIGDDKIADKYVFEDIYTKTKAELTQRPSKDKFQLLGTFKGGDGGNIGLGSFNIPQGAVKVYAGTRLLREGYDYIVDYMTGKVKMINPALLESTVPIRIETQNNSLFDLTTKTLVGTDLTYRFDENFYLGATAMYYKEQALYSKVNIGDEPVANFMWGVHGGFNTESDFLTRMLNKLPFYSTNDKATIDVKAEFAQIMPGHNKLIGETGNAYIDDFEGTKQVVDLRAPRTWFLASTPAMQPQEFPEAELFNDLSYGYNRGALSWFYVDPSFSYQDTPVKAEYLSNHYIRKIREAELFPNQELAAGTSTLANVLTVHFNPQERGQYNFDVEGVAGISAGIDAEGKLKKPETRWGGMMRAMNRTDFEANNVEYVEFWLLDPFIYDKDNKGELFFNLGEISEDILKDSRKSFENGLPTKNNTYKVDQTNWGYIPKIQSVVNSFDNNSINEQDLGLDGANNEQEKEQFKNYLERIQNNPQLGVASTAYKKALEDPANDDYLHFYDSFFDKQDADILTRYSRYNHLQGNASADNSASNFSTAYTTLPDVEDINRDNTLNESESYFQYRIALDPANMQVGTKYITDKMTVKAPMPNGKVEDEDWYQFKIPVKDFEKAFGGISDFRSIRFMRMYLKGFAKPVTLRFSRLQLVQGSWRNYEFSLKKGNEGGIAANTDTNFNVSVVNLIENAQKSPINYVMPPNIVRVIDPSQGNPRKLNEQGLLMQVENLEEGDARAVFKSIRLDIRRYKRLMMDVHAELLNNNPLSDGKMSVFLRLGADFTDNYYEYELPLKLTPPGVYSDSRADREMVWPDANRFDFELELLKKVKMLRNKLQTNSGGSIDYQNKFIRDLEDLDASASVDKKGHKLSVKGNPNLMNLRTVMIGVRNTEDGGTAESVEVWVNELRVAEFDKESGWAANLNVTTNLSDLGAVSFSGQMMTSGFGSISDRLNQRSQEDVMRYDVAANLDAGKLLPEKLHVQIPLYYTLSELREKPKYNNLDPDIPLQDALKNTDSQERKDMLNAASRKFVKNESFSITDFKVLPKENQKVKPWSLSNLSATYAQNETYQEDPSRSHDLERNYKVLLKYEYNTKLKPFEPFKKSKFLSTKYYRLIKDINFYYFPSRISIRSDMNRHYRSIVRRNVRNANFLIKPTFNREFLWNRYYDIDFPLTNSLKMTISAVNMSRVEEDYERGNNDLYNVWKGIMWDNFRDGGSTIDYNHNLNIEYKVPLNKVPLLNWIKATATYNAEYRWNAGPQLGIDSINVGNAISNRRDMGLGVNLDLVRLYNKSDYLKEINVRYSGRPVKKKKTERKRYEQAVELLIPKRSKLITHNMGTKSVYAKIYDGNGKIVRASRKIVNANRIRITVYDTVRNARVQLIGTVREKQPFINQIGTGILRTLMGIRNLKIEYKKIQSTSLRGFLPTPSYFGMTNFGYGAPGLDFVVGTQKESFLDKFAQKNYLTHDALVNDPYLMNLSEKLTLRSTIEPFKAFRITLNANRDYFDNHSQYYSFDKSGVFSKGKYYREGNLSMSYISLQSSFFNIDPSTTHSSVSFQDFMEIRKEVSKELAQKHYGTNKYATEYDATTGFYKGFGGTSQEVLVKSFHKAYGGTQKALLPSIFEILPNWKITYSGLNNVAALRTLFKRINLEHNYQSRYVVGGYATNMDYVAGQNKKNDRGDFIPAVEVNSISIDEKFNPLLGVNMEWVNGLTTNVSINRGHLLQLNVGSSMLTETANNEWVFDFGYRFKDVEFFVGRGARNREFENNLNILLGFTLRRDFTVMRQLADGDSQITSGQESLLYKLAVDYALSERLNIRLFYDRNVRNPYVSRSYPTIVSNVGLGIRFNFTGMDKQFKPFGNKKKKKKTR